jgi:hypothetical protein
MGLTAAASVFDWIEAACHRRPYQAAGKQLMDRLFPWNSAIAGTD